MTSIGRNVKVRDYATRFQKGHQSFLGPGDGEEWYGTNNYKPEGQWNSTADVVVPISKTAEIQFSEHPVRWTEDTMQSFYFAH